MTSVCLNSWNRFFIHPCILTGLAASFVNPKKLLFLFANHYIQARVAESISVLPDWQPIVFVTLFILLCYLYFHKIISSIHPVDENQFVLLKIILRSSINFHWILLPAWEMLDLYMFVCVWLVYQLQVLFLATWLHYFSECGLVIRLKTFVW